MGGSTGRAPTFRITTGPRWRSPPISTVRSPTSRACPRTSRRFSPALARRRATPSCQRPHDRVLPRDHRREVDLDRLDPHAQPAGGARDVRGARARDQRLGGRAAGVDAGAAELAALREEDLPAGCGRGGRRAGHPPGRCRSRSRRGSCSLRSPARSPGRNPKVRGGPTRHASGRRFLGGVPLTRGAAQGHSPRLAHAPSQAAGPGEPTALRGRPSPGGRARAPARAVIRSSDALHAPYSARTVSIVSASAGRLSSR